MKNNYQTDLELIINNNLETGRKPALMLHSCCGPCSSYVLDYLKNHFDITVFYYNPNIYPEDEYDHRLSEQRRLINEMNKDAGMRPIRLVTVPYDHNEFLSFVAGLENEHEGGARCAKCFELRLKKTYELAKNAGSDYYGTTLTVSPHKNALLINNIGYEIPGTDHIDDHVMWLPSDFKKKNGYKQSIELSKKYDLYRQNYCGCEFSMWFLNTEL